MKQRLTPPGSTGISVLLPCSLSCLLLPILLTFIVPLTQSKTSGRANSLNLNLEHHRDIVDELKTQIMQTIGETVTPRAYNASHRISNNQKIREFYRSKLNASSHTGDPHAEDIYLNDLQTVVFQSSDPECMVPVQPVITPSAAPVLTIVKFSTNFQQPDAPYHDLLIKSAILRMRISRQKRKLRGKANLPINVTFYLIEKSETNSESDYQEKYTPLRSVTIKTAKSKGVKVHIQPNLLSHLVESDNKTVRFGIRIHQTLPATKKGRNVKQNNQRHLNKTSSSSTASQQNEEPVRVSKIILQMTSQTKDLRKARTKRQDDDSSSCDDNLCCRHSVYVEFADIGWDWVIYPTGYTAYYCKGGCEESYKYASSFTYIKSVMHKRAPDVVPESVCAPVGYNPLRLMIDDGEFRAIDYPGMVVAGCRCH